MSASSLSEALKKLSKKCHNIRKAAVQQAISKPEYASTFYKNTIDSMIKEIDNLIVAETGKSNRSGRML